MNVKKTSPIKSTTSILYSYMLLFFLSSFLGWVWEVLVCWWAHDFSTSLLDLILHYRGVLHGPWAPIYGLGVITLALIWQLFKGNTLHVILSSIFACGTLEYVSGWILETLFHQKWWDYSGAFLSINGRICFISVFGFGIIGGIVILLFLPRYLKWLNRYPFKLLKAVNIILAALFLTDFAYSITQLINL